MTKAIVFQSYGSIGNLQLTSLPEPQSPSAAHALVRINAIGLNPRDLSIVEGKFKFLTGKNFPKLIAADFAGEIVSLSDDSSEFKVGERVFGYYEDLKGGVSSTLCEIPLKFLTRLPEGVKDETAAALGCTYLTAYQCLAGKAGIKKGDQVLVYGASGGVGTAALQLCRLLGAETTAVSHSRNREYCLAQGADHFLAYDREDVFQSGGSYDLFFQVYSDAGNLYGKAKKLVKKGGLHLSLIPNPLTRILGLFRNPKSDFMLVKSNPGHLEQIVNWVKSGQLNPHIDQVYHPEEFANAFEDLSQGKIRGKAIISMRD